MRRLFPHKLHKLSEGRKMFVSVMVIFVVYAAIFIIFEDYDRKYIQPFNEASDWHMLFFSLVVMVGLAVLLLRYARLMDRRISRQQTLKEGMMRRELTQNIAHELKTPVASILGYTDTILDNPGMDAETRQQFIVRTNAQAKRLTALLQDISILNRMDYATDNIIKERVDVSQIVAEITDETSIAVAQHQMTMRNCLPQSIIINGNASLVYSIFRNLVDNAVNYAGKGTTIEMTAEDLGSQWHFCFSDNGRGIDEQHLPRIFERFYRIDKGRSRELGGTGLGLAIVKNAVIYHGGTISISSKPSAGLRYDFTLRKKS